MPVTSSYDDPSVVPGDIRSRYKWIEMGSAAAILQATAPEEFSDLLAVLAEFKLQPSSWLVAGGNRGDIAAMLDAAFRSRGWRETRIDTVVKALFFTDFASQSPDSAQTTVEATTDYSAGYRVDNHKGRMIVDVEWNAKDGNLDRDLAAYRSWYEHGVINGAVIITKDRVPLLELARQVWSRYLSTRPEGERGARLPIDLQTSTTTSLDKAEMRVLRGGAGTCPILIVGVTDATWDGSEFKSERVD